MKVKVREFIIGKIGIENYLLLKKDTKDSYPYVFDEEDEMENDIEYLEMLFLLANNTNRFSDLLKDEYEKFKFKYENGYEFVQNLITKENGHYLLELSYLIKGKRNEYFLFLNYFGGSTFRIIKKEKQYIITHEFPFGDFYGYDSFVKTKTKLYEQISYSLFDNWYSTKEFIFREEIFEMEKKVMFNLYEEEMGEFDEYIDEIEKEFKSEFDEMRKVAKTDEEKYEKEMIKFLIENLKNKKLKIKVFHSRENEIGIGVEEWMFEECKIK